MKTTLFAIAAALLLALPSACMHPGHRGGPGGPGCQKHQGCDCKCRQQPDCPQTPDCPQKTNCPKHGQQQEAPPPAK